MPDNENPDDTPTKIIDGLDIGEDLRQRQFTRFVKNAEKAKKTSGSTSSRPAAPPPVDALNIDESYGPPKPPKNESETTVTGVEFTPPDPGRSR